MKTIITMLLALSFMFICSCDEDKKNRDTNTSWVTNGQMECYEPKGHGLKKLKKSDIEEANCFLEMDPVKGEYEQYHWRDVCTVSRWVLTDYSKPPHAYWPFKAKIGGVWVDTTCSIQITYVTKHTPKPDARYYFIVNDGTDPDWPLDLENIDTWSRMKYMEDCCD